MKLRKYKVVAIAFFTMLVSACSKKLDLKPTADIDASKAFQSVDDLKAGMHGAYAANAAGSRLYYGSLLADEVKLSDENRGQGQGEFKWQYSSAAGDMGDMGSYYTLIDRAHRVLEAADGIAAANAAEENFKKQMKAELTALRGVAYLEMLTAFMPSGYDPSALGVAILLKSDLLSKLPRNTVGEVMTQIETDLAAGRAEPLIQSAPDDPLRLSQSAIAAYQARAALLKRDWDKAISYAGEAITLSGKSLDRTSFQYYFYDDNESETIFKYRNNAAPQLNWRDNNGDVFYEPSDKLKSLYDQDNDIRYITFFSSDGADTSIVNKYPGSGRGPQINDIKLIRLAEMYLIRAEAYAEKDQLAQAAADMNALRK